VIDRALCFSRLAQTFSGLRAAGAIDPNPIATVGAFATVGFLGFAVPLVPD